MKPLLVLLLPLLMVATLVKPEFAAAKPYWVRGAAAGEADFLAPDEAFRMAARVDGNVLRIRWVIADGYYLYRSRIEVRAESPDLEVDTPVLPPGTPLTDAYFGAQEVYRQQVEATVGYRRLDYGAHPLQIKVSYQGCAQAGLCYPLLTKVIFPDAAPAAPIQPPAARTGSGAWEPVAIIAGFFAFLTAGLRLRTSRRLVVPSG